MVSRISLTQFYKLPNTIGCPDCDDSGREWIEVGTLKRIHKVTFEYGSDIQNLKDLLLFIRQQPKIVE